MEISDQTYTNLAASGIVSLTLGSTIGFGLAAAFTQSKIKTALCGTCALLSMSLTKSAVEAWLEPSSKTLQAYIRKLTPLIGVDLMKSADLITKETGLFIIRSLGESIKNSIQNRIYLL